MKGAPGRRRSLWTVVGSRSLRLVLQQMGSYPFTLPLQTLLPTSTKLTLHRQELGLKELALGNNLFLIVGVFVPLCLQGLQLGPMTLLSPAMMVKATIEVLHHLLLINNQASEHGFHRSQPLVSRTSFTL